MTLRQRVTASALVGVLVIVGLGGWLTYRFVRAADASSSLIATSQPAADASRTLSTAYADAQGYVSAAILDSAVTLTTGTVEIGCGDPRTCYGKALESAITSLRAVQAAFPGDAQVQAAVTASAEAADAWQRQDAQPVFDRLGRNDVQGAAEVNRSADAQMAADTMTSSALVLQQLIDERRAEQVSEYALFASRLAWALGITGLTLLALTLFLLALLTRWVLDPLDQLRAQLQAAATPEGRYRPISPSGPPELEATGIDAESMRRQLVAQIDEAAAARAGLDQQGPVVAAIRAELEARADVVIPGLAIAGALQPAEGVLAGDWWDVLRLPDGTAAMLVTDVAGHGPVAGIGAVRLKNVIGVALSSGLPPELALERAAVAFRDEEAQFATCAVIVVDPGTGIVRWANAGHPPPLLRKAGGSVMRLTPTGPLISGLGGTWASESAHIAAGDLLVAWSDGLAESHDAAGKELGDSGLIALITNAVVDGAPPAEVVERVLAAARDRSVDWRRDDVTLTALALAPG